MIFINTLLGGRLDIEITVSVVFILLCFLVVVCEDAVAEFDCTSYPGIIDVYDVEFVKENAYACENGNKTDQCVASGEEEKNLKSALGKSCNGKRICRIHMTDGLYDDIKIPCRDLGIKIRIQLIYDCIFCKFNLLLCIFKIRKLKTLFLGANFRERSRGGWGVCNFVCESRPMPVLLALKSWEWGGGTPHRGLHGEAPPGRGAFL